jgi:SP family sugar:H+ symporter-like MFS transporter
LNVSDSSSEASTSGASTKHLVFLCGCAALGGFLFGFDSAVINGTVSALQAAFGSSTAATGFSVASVLLGCAVGALLAGPSADRFGRKAIMIGTAILFGVSSWGSGVAQGSTEFVIYRLIGGLGVGAASVVGPAYIAEIAPPHIRGRLASLQQLAIVVGILMAFVSNFVIASLAGSPSMEWLLGYPAWRWMFWVELLPSALYLMAGIFLPESPRFLVAKDRLHHARDVIQRLWGSLEIERVLEEIQHSLRTDRRPRLADVMVPGRLFLPIVWVGVGLSVFQQFVGINVVFYYGAVLWEAAGFSEQNALLINVISGVVNIGSTLVAMSLIDKIGRKPLLLAGSLGMALTLGTLAVTFGTSAVEAGGHLQLSSNGAMVALGAAHLYIFFFGVSWGPVVWVLLGEMFNNNIRGSALAVSSSAQWIANFGVTMTFPILLQSFGLLGAYGLYTIAAGISLFFVGKYVSETKGKTLEQM